MYLATVNSCTCTIIRVHWCAHFKYHIIIIINLFTIYYILRHINLVHILRSYRYLIE